VSGDKVILAPKPDSRCEIADDKIVTSITPRTGGITPGSRPDAALPDSPRSTDAMSKVVAPARLAKEHDPTPCWGERAAHPDNRGHTTNALARDS
jgi:hypothetical protein